MTLLSEPSQTVEPEEAPGPAPLKRARFSPLVTAVIGAIVGAVTASLLAHGWPDPPSFVVMPAGPTGHSRTADGPASPIPSSTEPSSTASSPPLESASPQPATLASVTLRGPNGEREHITVAQLGTFLGTVNRAGYNVTAGIAEAFTTRCVETVVVDNLSAASAVVYETGLPGGLSGAEGAPPRAVLNGAVHQQLVLLTATALSSSLTLGANLQIGTSTTPLGTATLRLKSIRAGVATLALNDQVVECTV